MSKFTNEMDKVPANAENNVYIIQFLLFSDASVYVPEAAYAVNVVNPPKAKQSKEVTTFVCHTMIFNFIHNFIYCYNPTIRNIHLCTLANIMSLNLTRRPVIAPKANDI